MGQPAEDARVSYHADLGAELSALRHHVGRLERENEELRNRLDTCQRIMAENIDRAVRVISIMAKERS